MLRENWDCCWAWTARRRSRRCAASCTKSARASSRARLADTFARRWAQAEPEALGYLYIDGHVRPYHGRRHRIPKTFVQRRRLCMPATTEVWVNDARAQPWFFVTTEANDHLLATIERDILAPLRKEVGAQRRVTLVFDREGLEPEGPLRAGRRPASTS